MMTETRTELAEVREPESLMAVIARAASDPTIDIEKMDRLLQMQERLQMRAAEAEFNDAMTAAQTEMGRVKTNKDNSQTKSRYADYASLDRVLRPIYTKHGFALSFNTAEGAPTEMVRVLCIVSRGGFSRTYHVDMPADGKGAKGGDVMTKTHATGAAMTYGMRYLLKMIFNVAIGEDDTDGNIPGALITEDQAMMLNDFLEEVAGLLPTTTPEKHRKAFLAHMKVETLKDIQAKDYKRAIDAINSTRPNK
jgi:hypothetical protein